MNTDQLFKTESIKIGILIPNVKNPRKIKADEKRKLLERIQKFGFIGLPVCDFNYTLLGGHKRLEILAQNGLADHFIDVRRAIRPLSEAEQAEILVIENTHAGEFDLKALHQNFAELIDLSQFDFDLSDLQAALTDDDPETDTPELPIVAKMSEHYTSFVIVCTNEIDENHIAEKLGIDKMKCYKSSKIGTTHVVSAQTFIDKWSK